MSQFSDPVSYGTSGHDSITPEEAELAQAESGCDIRKDLDVLSPCDSGRVTQTEGWETSES